MAYIEEISEALLQFDGKDISDLKIVAQHKPDRTSSKLLASFLTSTNDHARQAASWLALQWLQAGEELSEYKAAVVAHINDIDDWPSQLHIVQSVRYLSLDETDNHTLFLGLKELSESDNKFVRAWSLDAMLAVSESNKQRMDATLKKLQDVLESDESAAVKARVRSLLKQL